MELYTLVSLLIGLFGGTFAALNGMRTLLDADFTKISSEAADQAAGLIEITGDGHEATTDCKRFVGQVTACSRIWRYVSITQVMFFTILIYLITTLAIWNWREISTKHTDAELATLVPVNFSPWMLGIGMVINLIFIITALIAYWYCRILLRRIKKLVEYIKPPVGMAPGK